MVSCSGFGPLSARAGAWDGFPVMEVLLREDDQEAWFLSLWARVGRGS